MCGNREESPGDDTPLGPKLKRRYHLRSMANRETSNEKSANVSRIQMEYLGVCDGPLEEKEEEIEESQHQEEEEE